ncbi:MAG TPA: J domain-containing protein [Acidimicrobiia bacterium]|nr:J domain-containing protein [Acidimicrobiia bacterium]
MAKDYYAVLGVSRTASAEEIKKAFRRHARESHPDANPGDTTAEARFRDAAEAYEVLSDPNRRAAHDRGDILDLGDLLGGFAGGGLDDLLRSVFGEGGLFGAASGGGANPRGRDVLTRVQVSLAQAAFGTPVDVGFRTSARCEVCDGSGATPGTDRHTCPTCQGSGAQRVARRGILGTMMSVTACATCRGTGEIISDPCETCRGQGTVQQDRTVRVEVPPGVETGTRLRLNHEGEAAGRNGRAGDLFVEIMVLEDERFERHGEDLVHRTSVGIAEAALGTTIEVPLIDDETTELDVPAGTQPGWVARIPGRGMTRLGRRGRGDLAVVVDVEVPTDLSSEEEELLRRFAQLRSEQPAGRKRRWI